MLFVRRLAVLIFVLSAISMLWAQSQTAGAPAAAAASPPAAASGPAFDVKAATDADPAKVPPDKRARSDAYFEGGYWLQLWDFLLSSAILILLLQSGLRHAQLGATDLVMARRSGPDLFHAVSGDHNCGAVPARRVREGYFREHKYGLATQTFGPWMRDQAVGLAVGAVLGGLAVMGLYWIVRRLGKNWWVWGTAASIVFFAITVLISPVYIAPLFNTYTKLNDPKIQGPDPEHGARQWDSRPPMFTRWTPRASPRG